MCLANWLRRFIIVICICSARAAILNENMSFILPGSGTDEIRLLNRTTNVNQTGVFLYRVDDPTQVHLPGMHIHVNSNFTKQSMS